MNTNINKKYKDRNPIETIQIIKNFFQTKNYKIKVKEFSHTKYNVYWCGIYLYLNDIVILKSAGKGTSPLYSLASGYAEMYERFCNQVQYYINPFIFQNNFELYNYDDFINIEELLKDKTTQDFYSAYFNNNLKNFNDFLNMMINYNNKIPGQYYINLISNEKKLFNPTLINRFVSTTGLAAGNTLEEALIQGMSEWFERYITYLVITNPASNYYSINKKLLPRYLQNIINNIEKNNQKIYIIDYSYTFNLPVCGILLIDLNNYKYQYTFGSAPSANIAIERCLTELFQGINNNWQEWNTIQQPFKSLNLKNEQTIQKMLKGTVSRNSCPFEFTNFIEKNTYNYNIFLKDINISNINLLQHYKNIISQQQIELYYKDISICDKIFTIRVYCNNINIYSNNFLNADYDEAKNRQYLYLSAHFYNLIKEILNYSSNNDFIKISYYLNILKQINNLNSKELINFSNFIGFNYFISPLTTNYQDFMLLNITKCLDNKDLLIKDYNKCQQFSFYFMIYNYLHSNYSVNEIQQILSNFNISITNEEIEKCYYIEYIIYQTFLSQIYYEYNHQNLKQYLNSIN